MKQRLALFISLLALTALSFTNPPDTIVGRWQKKFKGMTALFVIRADNTSDIFVNGKLFTTGKYTIRQDTFAMADPKCNLNYYGTYKLDFFAPDSVRFITIQDTCRPRNRDMHNVTLGRVTTGQADAAKP